MTVILMSRSEIDRMNVLLDLADDRIRVSEAVALMGLGRRQVFRLGKVFRQRGPTALVSRRRRFWPIRAEFAYPLIATGQRTSLQVRWVPKAAVSNRSKAVPIRSPRRRGREASAAP